ncbi:MAG: PGF-pre-PGF domain-containing protein [Candidatus Methanoperedens sp.]|nr:PGF-pre-PGF domain-containing protein [Candidatus Methanoperedens sp.]
MNLKIILLLLVIMLSNLVPAVSATIVSSTGNTIENLTDAYTDGYTLAGKYNDEFNQGVLDTSRWEWIRENRSAWWMSSWYLGMNITNTSLYQGTATSPLLLQNYGGEDITIISKQWFNPITSVENAGIIIYANDDNFVNAQYFIIGGVRKVVIQKEDNNLGNSTATTVTLSQPHYIKLVKAGTNYSLYYSNDTKTWTYSASVNHPGTMTKIGYVTGGAPSNHPVYYDAFVTDNFITTGNLTSVFNAGFGGVIKSTLFMYTNASDSHIDGYASKDNITWTLLQTDMPNNTYYTIPPEIQNRTVYVRAVLRGTSTSTPVLQQITAQSGVTPIPPRSDDFNSPALNTTLWEVIDPAGDSKFTMEGKDTADAFLNITVPCCVTHAPFTTNNAPRIMQEVSNVDFEIEAKFQSLLTEQHQEQGFIIEESPGNYIRIDFNGDGNNLKSYAGTFRNNVATQGYNTLIHSEFSQPVPLYLRVNRSGNNWSYRYSYNGVTWTNVTNFTYDMNVAKVGVFIGNENTIASLTPKFTGNIDYFFNTASPIIPEDIPDTTPPVINVWYGLNQRFGHLGTPQTWINILGNVSDSSSAVVALNYSLNNGATHQLVLGKDNLRLENINDFNIEEGYTNFSCGSNHIDLSANDSAGNVNNTRVNINYTCGIDWPMPYTVDWSTVSDIQDVAQVVDGQWVINNGKATPVPGYDRIIAMGNMAWKNYTVTVPITLNSAMTVPGANFGIVMRWKEHVFWSPRGAYPREGWYPLGAIAGYFNNTKSFGGNRLALLGNKMILFANDTTATQLEVGSTYNFKVSAQTAGINQVFSLKVWKQGTQEPANWTVSGNAPAGALTQGSVLFTSYYSDVSFGNVAITNLDTQAKIPPSSNPNGSYTGMEGKAVYFDGSKSFDPDGNIMSYYWDFGDGNSSIGMSTTHIYAQNGTYTVSLKVTDNDGLNAINSTKAVIADKNPVPNFTGTPTTGPAPLNILFTDSSTSYDGIVSWSWDFTNDGTPDSNLPNPSHSYPAGTYTVALTVCENDGDCNTEIKTNYITATSGDIVKPVISITYPANGQILNTSSIIVSGTSSGDVAMNNVDVKIREGAWQRATGTASWTIHATLSPGLNTIYARANDTSGNSNETSIIVTYDVTAPSGVTGLANITYAQNYINWTWFDPDEPDFDHVEVYLNGLFKSNITKGIRSYNATGLTSATSYTIGLKSVDISGNVNSSMVNHTARTVRNTITSSVNLTGNNISKPIILENQALIDITANNSSVSGYITLTADTNITRLNGSVNIANSTSGIQAGGKALNRYVEIDSTGINKSNISSVNLTMFYTDEDISGLDENTLKVYWWNGSIWKPLDPKGKDYSNENGPIVIDIRRNQTANKLTVQLNHFSTFALAGTPSTPPNTPCNYCSSGSSGGGGGGGGSSGESASNIELIEKYDMQISKDVTTSYRFTHVKNPVMFVNITGNTSLGIITVSEEVLKSTSSLVKIPPGGLVYKNINIWVGTSGYATPKNIKEASIKFRVDNTWMSANGVASSDIVLVKWNGDSWIELETSVLSGDDTNTFFEGKTNAFSPFAIAVKMGGVAVEAPSVEITQQIKAKAPDNNENSSQPAKTAINTWIAPSGVPTWSAILIILVIIIILVAMYFRWMKK